MPFQVKNPDPLVTGPNTKVSLVRASNTHRALSKQFISQGVIFGIDSPALVQILDL